MPDRHYYGHRNSQMPSGQDCCSGVSPDQESAGGLQTLWTRWPDEAPDAGHPKPHPNTSGETQFPAQICVRPPAFAFNTIAAGAPVSTRMNISAVSLTTGLPGQNVKQRITSPGMNFSPNNASIAIGMELVNHKFRQPIRMEWPGEQNGTHKFAQA